MPPRPRKKAVETAPGPKLVRVAVYTRKSLADGLEKDFNSLDAQREACGFYVKSQANLGWTLAEDRYDDGGFTGANLERPAFRRLLADIKAGKIQVVVVHRLDRLSRSLPDFVHVLKLFTEAGVAFVSVTQNFSTADAVGRLTLNMLMSFAEFEREMIAERTSDKMSAARRRGKWTGGMQLLGYDVAEGGGKLIVNEREAAQVREIFGLYIEQRSLLATAELLNRRGWRTKSWVTRDGRRREGGLWTKEHVRRMLSNPLYIGKVAHAGGLYRGEQPAILDEATFARAQELLGEGRHSGASGTRNSFGYLLKGLVRCAACGSAMSPSTTHKGARRYRYYACGAAKKSGRSACPVRSVPADELERFVLDRVRAIGQDRALVDDVLTRAAALGAEELPRLDAERDALSAEQQRVRAEGKKLVAALGTDVGEDSGLVGERIREIDGRVAQIDRRLAEIEARRAEVERSRVDEAAARAALEGFDPVWRHLDLRERERILRLLLDAVEYDGVGGEIVLKFRALGLKSFTDEMRAPAMKRVKTPNPEAA